jgi:hypothetical protein
MMRCRLIWLVFLLPAAPGCLFAHRPPLVPIQVVDAETRQPIPGAHVRLWRPESPDASLGQESEAPTGTDGIARVRARTDNEMSVAIEVSAAGYLPADVDLPGAKLDANDPNEKVRSGTTVALFAGPRPTVDFVLPAGFRGLLKADLRMQDAPAQANQRVFSGIARSDGKVVIAGSPVLSSGLGPVYRARFSDNQSLTLEPKEHETGLRFLKSEGDTRYFVVGTLEDWKSFRKSMNTDPPGSRSSGGRGTGGGGGGRGGGRGGRGGMGGGGMGGGR